MSKQGARVQLSEYSVQIKPAAEWVSVWAAPCPQFEQQGAPLSIFIP